MLLLKEISLGSISIIDRIEGPDFSVNKCSGIRNFITT